MFGIGGTELIVILVVALLFLGPDKLPEAAKTLSRGIRDLKKQSKTLQQTIENDERIGGAIRDIKSALRGEDELPPRKPFRPNKPQLTAPTESLADKPGESDLDDDVLEHNIAGDKRELAALDKAPGAHDDHHIAGAGELDVAKPKVKLPPTAGEPDSVHHDDDDDDLAAMIRPAAGTVAKGASSSTSSPSPSPSPSPSTEAKTPETKHG